MSNDTERPPYGVELILDLHECDSSRFTRRSLKDFFRDLCELIDMEPCELHFWDDVDVPLAEQQTDPKTKGRGVPAKMRQFCS